MPIFLKGHCKFGDNCTKSHEGTVAAIPAKPKAGAKAKAKAKAVSGDSQVNP